MRVATPVHYMTRSVNDRRTVQRLGILDYGDISIHDRESIERFLHKHRIDPYAFRRLHYALCVEGRSDERAWAAVPPRFRGPLEQAVRLHYLSAMQPQHSTGDGATKFVFKTNAGQSTESVAMLATTGRTTACISSQVGCAAACPFCATGNMGLRDQLRCGEILDQVVQIRQWFRQQQLNLRNIVFMGMGEPLHNEPAVYAAIEQLQHSDVFRFSPRRIMVSTVGVIDAARRFLTRFPRTGFALSLHAAEQELREALIPLARFNRLPQLRTLLEAACNGRRSVMIEYLMLKGVNDALSQARELCAFLRDLPVHVNLIPHNRLPGVDFERSPRPLRDAFASVLREAGFFTTIRYSQGRDISAACGQLAGSVLD